MKTFRVFETECRWMPDSKGGVTTWLQTERHKIQIYVTKTGKVRVWKDNVEMQMPDAPKKRKARKK